jgi:hypothetical protein
MVQINNGIVRQDYSVVNVRSILRHVYAVYDRTPAQESRAKRQALEIYAAINNTLIDAGKLLTQKQEMRDPKNLKVIGNIFFSSKHKPTPEIIAESLQRNSRSFKSFCLELAKIRVNNDPIKTSSAPCLFLNYWQIDIRIGGTIKTLSYAPDSWAIVGDKDRYKKLKHLICDKFAEVSVEESTPILPIGAGNHYMSYLNKFPLGSIIETANQELESHQLQFNQLASAIECSNDDDIKANHLSKQKKLGVIIRKYEDFLNTAPTFQNTLGYISGPVSGKSGYIKEVLFNVASKQLPWTMDLINAIHEHTTNIVTVSEEVNELSDDYVVYSPLNLNLSRERLDSGYSVTTCKLSIRIARIENGQKKIINIFMTPNTELATRYSVEYRPEGSAELISIFGPTIKDVVEQVSSIATHHGVIEIQLDDDNLMEDPAVADFFIDTVDASIEEAGIEVTA